MRQKSNDEVLKTVMHIKRYNKFNLGQDGMAAELLRRFEKRNRQRFNSYKKEVTNRKKRRMQGEYIFFNARL